jgi:hypothetical protein
MKESQTASEEVRPTVCHLITGDSDLAGSLLPVRSNRETRRSDPTIGALPAIAPEDTRRQPRRAITDVPLHG